MAALQDCKLIRVEGENDDGEICFRVHQWEKHNEGLLKRVAAGKKGAAERDSRRRDQRDSTGAKDQPMRGAQLQAKPSLLEAKPGFASSSSGVECSGVESSEVDNTPQAPSRGSSGCEPKSFIPEICRLYGRDETGPWDNTEMAEYRKVVDRPDFIEELALLGRLKKEPAGRVVDLRCQLRHRLGVGLKYWNAELDKARRYFELAKEQDNGLGGPVTFGE